jgi:hypothetical protein
VRLYHETARDNVGSILNGGFRDGGNVEVGPYGVFVADARPRFRPNWAVLVVEADLTEEELEAHAYNRRVWPPNGNAYREWCVPAARLNACSRPVVIA